MPKSAPHICLQPGCSELVYSGAYCAKHQKNSEQERGSAHRRGYGRKWQVIRAKYLEDHPWCVGYPRGAHGNQLVIATDVDHIQPRRAGGSDDENNLQPLCHSCHSVKTSTELGRGIKKVSDIQGETVRRSCLQDFPRSKL